MLNAGAGEQVPIRCDWMQGTRADFRGAGGGRIDSWEFGKTGNEVRGR
jgi:hypothetical protein